MKIRDLKRTDEQVVFHSWPPRALAGAGMTFLRVDFDACIAHLRFPFRHRRVIRTTTLLERLFLEERRWTKSIQAFGERPVLTLMDAAVIRAAERWRRITVSEFEQRQLKALREEFHRAHAERVAPAVIRPTPSSGRTLRTWPCSVGLALQTGAYIRSVLPRQAKPRTPR